MKNTLLPLAISLLLMATHAAPLPTGPLSPLLISIVLFLWKLIYLQDALQVREPLPPVWCVWDTDNDGET
jgi:hypothetical protein